jgi:protein TonB
VKSWVASLALHGAAAGVAALVWLEPAAPAPESLRWQVAFVPTPEAAPAPAPARIEPPRPAPAAEPAPASAAEPPPPAAPEPPPKPVESAPPHPPARPEAPAALPTPPVSLAARPLPAPAAAETPAPARPIAPVPARAAAPETVPDPAAEAERRWYLALLERLRTMKRYPMAARRLGQEGVVLVEARIGQDGRLEAAEVKRGSGFPLLDRDALRLIEAAAADARSQMQPERPTRLEIPIAYRLES